MNKAKPQVVIIAGPNGAGKSTLAPSLLRDTLGLREYVNADPIALGLSGFDPAGVAFKAGRVMMNRLLNLAEQKKALHSRPHLPLDPTRAGSRNCITKITISS